jgi:hypothetical protein
MSGASQDMLSRARQTVVEWSAAEVAARRERGESFPLVDVR